MSHAPFQSDHVLHHRFAAHYDTLRAIPDRRALESSAFYAAHGAALQELLTTVDTGVHTSVKPAPAEACRGLRAVAWNIQRGRKLADLLRVLSSTEGLAGADLYLLSEVDCGLGRSGNRHVARELAAALGLHYAFSVSYLVLGDDFLENPEGRENTIGLAGQAILSRHPIGRVENVDLPELRDKFSSKREKRLGKKRALLAEILAPTGPFTTGCVHLDSNASPHDRCRQLEGLLVRLPAFADAYQKSVLLGGDFNTTTYDASGGFALFKDLVHKFVVTGFNKTVDGYMIPELGYDRPLFELLQRHGFAHEGLNDRGHSTYNYDVEGPYTVKKLHSKVGKLPTRWLQNRLKPWKGCVPARLDWFFGRGIAPIAATVIDPGLAAPAPGIEEGEPISDHLPIALTFAPMAPR